MDGERGTWPDRLYGALLSCYPRRFRDLYGPEMAEAFHLRRRQRTTSGARAAFSARAFADLLWTAGAERKEAALAFARGVEPTPAAASDVTVERIPPGAKKPLTPDQQDVSRRQFLNRAWGMSFVGFLGLFGMSSLSFLWPKLTGGFGTKITAGDYEEILKTVGPEGGFKPLFISDGRFYLTYYGGSGDSPVYSAVGAVDTKIQALYRKCVHLGCSVPHCPTSMLFECPCHGSKYTLHGEYFQGPAPRGLDRFPVEIVSGKVIVDTGKVEVGPPRGTETWPAFAQRHGDFCVPSN
jgi:cytochrome b6-f complex iron-sulfur subunit